MTALYEDWALYFLVSNGCLASSCLGGIYLVLCSEEKWSDDRWDDGLDDDGSLFRFIIITNRPRTFFSAFVFETRRRRNKFF